MTLRRTTASLLTALGLLTIATPASINPASAEVKITVKTEYYTVRGRSIDALDKSLYRNAPLLNGTDRALGQARLRFDSDIRARESDRGCAVDDPQVTLEVVMILPRWADEKRANSELRSLWSGFAGFVRQHEERHVEIAMNHAKKLQRVFTNVPMAPNCKMLRARLQSGANRILAQHAKAQERFDAREQARMQRAARVVASRRPRASSAD